MWLKIASVFLFKKEKKVNIFYNLIPNLSHFWPQKKLTYIPRKKKPVHPTILTQPPSTLLSPILQLTT